MPRPNTNPSDAARDLAALKRVDHAKWKKRLEQAFSGGATIREAAEHLGGMARLTVQRHVKAYEEETGGRLERPRDGRIGEALKAPVRRRKVA